MESEHPPVPCKNFEDDRCMVWCIKNEGFADCCCLCCQRNTCKDVCPKSKKILSLPDFKNKKYSWEKD